MIEAFLVPAKQISEPDLIAMFDLLQTHFEGVHWQQFQTDLQGKDWVILLKLAGALKGFTTFLWIRGLGNKFANIFVFSKNWGARIRT